MNEARGIFVVCFLISITLSLVFPQNKTVPFKHFVKYLYYVPYTRYSEAINCLKNFPGKLLDIANLSEENRRLKNEVSEKNLLLISMEEKISQMDKIASLLADNFIKNHEFKIAFPSGKLLPSSDVLLLNGRWDLGSAVVSNQNGSWVVIGEIISSVGDVSECRLLTSKASRISVVGENSLFWGVLVGDSPGKCRIEFIWPTLEPAIKPQQKILTSGWDGIFPPGLLCGWVESCHKNKIGEYSITVKPASSVSAISEVFVLEK